MDMRWFPVNYGYSHEINCFYHCLVVQLLLIFDSLEIKDVVQYLVSIPCVCTVVENGNNDLWFPLYVRWGVHIFIISKYKG